MDSGDKGKKPVPKFASFKPKATHSPSPPATQPGTKSDKLAERHDRSKYTPDDLRSRDGHRSRRKHRDSRSRYSTKEPIPEERRDGSSHRELRQTQDDTDLYKVDTVGDRYNLTYGALNRYSIPLYYRAGSGKVLGLGRDYAIDRASADATSLVIRPIYTDGNNAKQKRRELWRHSVKGPKPKRLRRGSPAGGSRELDQDFVSLNSARSRKRRRVEDGSNLTESVMSDDELIPNYRSIEGKAQPGYGMVDEAEFASDSGIESDDENTRIRNANLSRYVEEHPDDLGGWIKLINHQNNMVGVTDSDGHSRLTLDEKRSVADIKISIYEKALKRIPPSAPRDRLLLGLMEEGSEIWDKNTLSSKWKKILESNPGYISLWIKYLDYQQTTFVNFTYEKCRAVFLECLKINGLHSDSSVRNIINLYILLRFSLFMREAGFLEHSIALWQAVLEFNFCRPQSLGLDGGLDAAISSFSEFWDSEAPRIGEEGAKGWDKAEGDAVAPKTDPTPPSIDRTSVFHSWFRIERNLITNSFLPARTLDEVQEDDPYRVVLFTDIADFLIPFSDTGLSASLIDAFLLFCHLPPSASHENAQIMKNWCGDPFFCNRHLDEVGDIPAQWFSSITASLDAPCQTQSLSFPQQNIGINAHTLFGDGRSWFSAFETWKSTYLDQTSFVDVKWVLRTLRQLVARTLDNDAIAEYTVALEYACYPQDAKKFAKSLLRARPSSIRLYNAYALFEARNGQMAAAERVWTTTLSMSQSFPEEARPDCILLWHTWIWESLSSQKSSKAMSLLLAIPDSKVDLNALAGSMHGSVSASPAEFLKTRRYLNDSQGHAFSFRKPSTFSDSTDCLAILMYLTRDQDIDSALDIYKAAEERLASHKLDSTTFLEPIHQAKARLLYHHLNTSRTYKPGLIRQELSKSATLFPQNTMFLSLLAFNESRFRIEDRVRSVLRQQLSDSALSKDSLELWTESLGQSTLIPHLFAIYTELHRGLSAGSTAHSARASFEAAIATRSGQCSAALWKLYIQFELVLSEKVRAREVFFRSIRACPWAKELVLLAFSEPGLRDEMETGELRRIWNVLAEKELRIHIDLEEWFEENEEG